MNDTLATSFELNELAAKLIRQQLLGQREIELVQKGVQALSGSSAVSSEIASISNNIWLLIHELPVQIYWITISNILNHAKIAYTRSLSLNSISKRIAYDWPHLQQHQKANITQYLFSLHNDAVERGNQSGMVGEATVALFRLEWGGLLNGFVARMTDNLAAIPLKNILFNLQLLKRVLRQSFDSWQDDFLTQEYEHFRDYMEGEMRQVMKLACFCLQESQENQLVVTSGLKFLLQIADIVPVFEIFNCELLEILQKLLKTKEFGKNSMSCLKEIFAFKEIGITQQHHSKIAKRLFSILQIEIQSCTSLNTVTNFDKQSSSTTDSICSRLTVSHNRPKEKPLSPDLVDLLYLYLTRYVPSMDSRPDQRFFEIQSDRSTKLLFQKELYDYFEKGFWRFVQFLIEFGTKSDQKLSALSQEEYQTQFRYLVCCKLILVLFGKLGLPYEDLLQKLLKIFIVRLAPLEKAFRKFYILFDLIMDETTVYIQLEEVHNYSEEYCQIYTQGMEVILKNRTLAQNYFAAVQKILLKIVENSKQQINLKKDKMEVCYKVNLVNRISWSLIHGFRAVSQALQPLQVNNIVTGFVRETFATKDVALKKCYSLNSKYILQAFKGTQFSNIIFSSLLCNSVDLVYQFNINLISNIIMHPLFVFRDLGNDWARGIDCLIKRVIEIRGIGTYGEEFNRIYPAMFRLGIKMLQHPSSKEFQQQLALQIKKWLKNLIYDSTVATIKTITPQNLIQVQSLKKLKQLLINFQDISVLLLEEGETRERGTYWMLKHHILELREIFKLLDFKYKQYSDYLQCRVFENFQVSEIVQFRERFNSFICNLIKLFSLRSRIQIKDQSIPAEKKTKIMNQRTQIIQLAEKRLFQDFHAQLQFKSTNYLHTALQYYKFLLIEKKANYSDLINQSIKGITAAFNQQQFNSVERMITAKLSFWKGLVSNFMEEVRAENIEELIKIYSQFAQYSAKNAELCLEIIERVLQKLESQYKEVRLANIWSQFMLLFRATFEKLFDEVCKKEQIFKRIASILYYSIVVADGSDRQLAGPLQGKKSNVEVLFLFIRQHVKNTVGECGELQERLLQCLFKQRNREKFVNTMKDYKVGLMRWIKAHPASTHP